MREARYRSLSEVVPQLQIADIVLIHARGMFVPNLIKHFTGSYWSHVAMVFALPSMDAHNHDVLLVEANDTGIEIHRFQKYLESPGLFDIGVKRLPGLTDIERDRIRGFFLDAVDTPYDTARLFGYFLSRVIKRSQGRRLFNWFVRRIVNVDTFICSSFVQRAFYLAVPPERRDKVILRNQRDVNFVNRMETISPAQIARSEVCRWLYNPHD